MKIHNYGNDYIQANKLKEESKNNVRVQTAEDRPMPPCQIPEETGDEDKETKEEEKEGKRGRKKKQAD